MRFLFDLRRTLARFAPRLGGSRGMAVAAALFGAMLPAARAATPLADQPLFATSSAPGNLALVLSVEFPTAISVAYVNRTYAPATEYLGYFDPNKCYTYHYTDGTGTDNYFQPAALARSHTCTNQWSGNFLNWATMPTIDPFRWVLTGGYRVIDDPALTVLEKAWATTQGSYLSNFPDSTVSNAYLAGATPFGAYSNLRTRIAGLGNKMRFVLGNSFSLQGKYYNSKNLSGAVALSRTDYDFSSITGNAAPGPGVNTNNFSASWTASITAPATGVYNFQTVSDDGVRLYINGTQIINNWTDHGATTDTGTTTTIAANSTIDIRLEYYQGSGNATLSLNWQPPGATSYTPIGASGAGDLAAPSAPFTGSNATSGSTLDLFVRAKVCDASVGLEQNCVGYPNGNSKPEGLMQQYSKKIRYSAFGYLNDSNILRDGGVLRAQQNFVGPIKPVPGSPDVSNPAAEWDAATGVFLSNPAPLDASNTSTVMGLPTGSVVDSGVLNYLNKFGEIKRGSYKTYDPVSELYYAAIRYYKNLPNVPEWTSVPGGTSDANRIIWTDGFPVITAPADPILYSCQRNFILGIGDTNTWADKDLPGNSLTSNEPGVPPAVAADPTNEVNATNRVGVLEGLGSSLGLSNGYAPCCDNNSALMAGAAYEAHVNDIRPDPLKPDKQKQTIDTFWVDVLESQVYANNNKYYLATKYGGFDVPAGYLYSNTTPLLTPSWHTNTDTFGSNPRPDNYFSGGQPERMKAGLETAFKKIVNAIGASTTSFASSLPQVAVTGNASYSASYDATVWTGEVSASVLNFVPATNSTTLIPKWDFSSKLAAQLAGNGWSTTRRVITWNGTAGVPFRLTDQLTGPQQTALNPSYVSSNPTDYLNYLRGDQSHEIDPSATAPSTTKIFRARPKLVGDIVGSKANPTGPPSFPFSDATNPGYAAFKTTWASRRTVVYIGANDGMLHAINGALDTTPGTPPLESDAKAGQEMFAYVPAALYQGPSSPSTPSVDGLASLGNKSFAHHYLVNATPNVADVDFARVPSASRARQTPTRSTDSDWHSVLIGGLGKGGKSYYALDVTNPVGMANGDETNAASKVLWEFSNSTLGVKDPITGRDRLGYTYGDPMVMKTAKYGWVVVLMSGYNNGDANGKGYFFFVNPKTGALLEAVPTHSGVGATGEGVDMGLATGNAFIVDATDGTADAIYAGDLFGNVWRLDVTALTGNYPDAVNFAQLTDANGTPQPITTRPAIEVDPKTRLRYVLVGTGRLLANPDVNSTQGQSFYALLDGTNLAFSTKPPPANVTFPITRSLLAQSINANAASIVAVNQTTQAGWYEDLNTAGATPSSGIAYRVVSDLTTSTGTVSFPAILTNGDVCSPSGSTRVYARNFANAQNTLRFLENTPYAAFGSYAGTATDLHYQSVGGKLRLVLGTDKGGAPLPVPITESVFNNRRLNWRELQVVE